MIDCGTLAGLLEHRHQLAAYCPRCQVWRVLPLDRMVAAGMGSRRLPIVVRCRDCGTRGTLQVRPPVPTLDPRRVGWIAPGTP